MRDSSKALLQHLADEGVEFAASRLRNYNQKWKVAVERRGVRYKELFGEASEETVPKLREAPARTLQEMSVAERLGRAMIALWQAERTSQPERRDQLCVHAQQLLDVSEAEAGELLTGFVETRGLVLLAKVMPSPRLTISMNKSNAMGVEAGLACVLANSVPG